MRKVTFLLTSITVMILALLALFYRPAAARTFPELIPLPDGFQPEGIVAGRGATLYAGSLADGSIYQVNVRTGEGELLVQGQSGQVAVGLSFDRRSGYLFVAGGPTGTATVYDTKRGELVAQYQLAEQPAFINDVIVTSRAAYFTNSLQPVFYRVPLGPAGQLPAAGEVESIPLAGDFEQVEGFNANGIEAAQNGRHLIIVNTALGMLYKVDPETGVAVAIDLGDDNAMNGDGLLLQGNTLYVVQNFLNQVAVIRLDRNLTSGELVDTITHEAFDIPTTITSFGNALYVVNARFSTPPAPDTEYNIVRIRAVRTR
jgi:hypothetical protein